MPRVDENLFVTRSLVEYKYLNICFLVENWKYRELEEYLC